MKILYEIVGFEEVKNFGYKRIKKRVNTNPDLQGQPYQLNKRSLGKSNLYTLLITSKYNTYEGKRELLGKSIPVSYISRTLKLTLKNSFI